MENPSVPRIVEFPLGLPGFEHSHRFTLLQTTPPLFILESAEPEAVRFYAIPVSILDDAYQIEVTEEVARLIGATPNAANPDLEALAILATSTDGGVTANLLAPILLHISSGLAVQAVRGDARYSHRYPVLPPSNKAQHAEDSPC